MEISVSNFSEEENEDNDDFPTTTFETNEETIKKPTQKSNYIKLIDSESEISHISSLINTEMYSSTEKEISNEENNKKEDLNNNKEIEEDNESRETKEDSNNIKINYIFVWEGKGNNVKITGSFCEWRIKFDMNKDPNDNNFKCQLPLDNKKYQFKFIVDDEWKFSEKYPTEEDKSGNINNIIDLTNYNEKKEEQKQKTSRKKLDNENKKQTKIKKIESIYSNRFPSGDNIMPLPLPNKIYYKTFNLDNYSHQKNIGNKNFLNYSEKYSFTYEMSSKPIFIFGHVNLNHLISIRNKKMINVKHCMSFRFREKDCTFIYYK